jgi:MerR family transcriptional regulator, copper efflux regulator
MLIGELAKVSGLSKDGIRHYERLGIISSTRRSAGSRWYCDYDASVLESIEKARGAQQLGLSLKEIAPLLKADAEREMSRPEAITFLRERLRIIREKITGLRDVEAFLVQKLAGYGASDK